MVIKLLFGYGWVHLSTCPLQPSQNDWPTSLGSCNSKAFDTALVLEWMEHFLEGYASWRGLLGRLLMLVYSGCPISHAMHMSESFWIIFFLSGQLCIWSLWWPLTFFDWPKDCSHDELLQGLKYAVAASNLFFKTMRSCGVFIMQPMKDILYHAGQEMCASWTHFKFRFHNIWCHAVPKKNAHMGVSHLIQISELFGIS